MPIPPHDLDAVTAAAREGAKYATLAADFVRAVAAREAPKHARFKEAVKATRNKLHQVAGAYLDKPPDYPRWLAELEAAPDLAARRAVCARLMAVHASTRERLPLLDRFYAELFAAAHAEVGPVRRVLDLACGFNPLAAPWMPLEPGAHYAAYDVYDDLADFLRRALPTLGAATVEAAAVDVTQRIPPGEADLALIVKAIPCLMQLDKDAGRRVLLAAGAQARAVAVTYPAVSLGGRQKGMREFYAAQFAALLDEVGWDARPPQRLDFESELVFVVIPPPGAQSPRL
jgi:16S rRNA (guanine(1405)-N(7))-methyltransferase